MSMKIITVPKEVLVYPSNYTCPHRGRIGFHGIRLDSGICFFDSKNQRNCQGPVDDPEGFPEWCPLEEYDPADNQEKTCVNCPDKDDDTTCCARLRSANTTLQAKVAAMSDVVEAAKYVKKRCDEGDGDCETLMGVMEKSIAEFERVA